MITRPRDGGRFRTSRGTGEQVPEPTIDDLAAEYFDALLEHHPIGATMLGIRDHDDAVPDLSEEAEDAWRARLADLEERARAFDDANLDRQGRLTREVLIFQASSERAALGDRLEELNVSPLVGPHATILNTVPKISLREPEHAEDYLERCSKLDRYLHQAAERLRSGLEDGRTPPARNVRRSIDHIDAYLASDADPLAAVLAPDGWEGADAWRSRLEDVVRTTVRPALEAYRSFLEGDVLPRGRDEEHSGICHLEDGEEIYRRAIREHTTTDRDPEEIHELGLRLVEQLRDEYAELGAQVLGADDPDEVMRQIREDEDLRFGSGDEMVEMATAALRRAQEASPDWFGVLPDAPCEVRIIPEHEAPTAPPAYYQPPATDGSRPGIYWQNTNDPTERTRVELESIAFHEAVPGHHFQIALAQEQDLPRMRRHGLVTAYVEGWGLYAERLADEMQLYVSDLSRLGMLVTDSMRACRLVIDTGIHHRAWSRQRAVDYFTANSPMPAADVESEVDRYIAWPGQALAYMIGRQEIVRLRERAEAELDGGFDIRDFHDAILVDGPVPLEVLTSTIERWIDDRR